MANIFFQYLAWQFLDVPKGVMTGWRNCLQFNLNHWSVPLLLRTWFSPWRQYKSSYGRGFSFTRYFEAFTFNMTSRVLGAIMRTFFIILGILTEVMVFLAGAVVFLFWLILPFLLLGGLFYGWKILL
jgi:hypothetical protein